MLLRLKFLPGLSITSFDTRKSIRVSSNKFSASSTFSISVLAAISKQLPFRINVKCSGRVYEFYINLYITVISDANYFSLNQSLSWFQLGITQLTKVVITPTSFGSVVIQPKLLLCPCFIANSTMSFLYISSSLSISFYSSSRK